MADARRRTLGVLMMIALALGTAGCSEAPAGLAAGSRMELVVERLRPLDPAREGSYELWLYSAAGDPVSGGRFELGATDAGAPASVAFDLPVADPSRIVVTVEPLGDADGRPSPHALLGGRFDGRTARLSIAGSVTDGRPLESEPGHHSLFTTSNNVEFGYPSLEHSGLWLFSISVLVNKHRTREVKLTPLQRGWLYEGWIVYRQGTPDEVWISYGKYRPDPYGLLTSRDNTGSGPFSGDDDYVNGGVEDVPGDEWTTTRIADHFGLRLPGGLQVPLILNAVEAATGAAVWHHAITIEPAFDEDEPLTGERPFLLRPYRNAIGAGGPGVPRKILYLGNDPFGEARLVR